jgi:iron complex transport system substrate-binding protein
LIGRAAEFGHRLREIATMFHACVMPSYRAKRERLWPLAATALALLAYAPLQASAADLPRIASINLCTDQLLVTLADPEQILGLSPYARDPFRSWDKDKAKAFRLLSGEAEDVLALKPDVVVAGRFTKRATRELLKDKGLKVTEFDPARSLDDVKKQLRQMGALVKHPERAEAEIAKLDTAIAQAHAAVQRKPLRVLAVSRRGWVSGGENLTTSLLSAVGLRNAGGELGLKAGGFASLEAIVTLRPDLLLVTDNTDFAEDEGRAFLLHPALEKFYPASKRLVLPERLTACGGPTMVEALDRLTTEISRVAP